MRRQQVESLPFGGLHLLICGDFYQLRCVSGVPLYNKSHALTSDNSKVKKRQFIELDENMRMKNCYYKLVKRLYLLMIMLIILLMSQYRIMLSYIDLN